MKRNPNMSEYEWSSLKIQMAQLQAINNIHDMILDTLQLLKESTQTDQKVTKDFLRMKNANPHS